MGLIDSHAHIYLNEFDPDRNEVISRSVSIGVEKILMPAIDSTTHQLMLDTEKMYPGICHSMMGLHPCSVKGNYREELELVKKYIVDQSFIAIGEIGLDFYWDVTYKEQQYEAFRQQLDWSIQHNLPVSIHSRNATAECIEVIREFGGQARGVFHCFSGNGEQARALIELWFYLGIGGVLTFKNSGLDTVVRNLDLKTLVLETDAPYLAPVPFRGKRNESGYLSYIVQKLADIKEMTVGQIAEFTTANAKNLFGL